MTGSSFLTAANRSARTVEGSEGAITGTDPADVDVCEVDRWGSGGGVVRTG